MTPEQRARLEELRKQNKVKLKAKGCDLSRNVLYKECVEAIKPFRIITDEKEIQKIIHDMSMSEIKMYEYNEKADLCDEEHFLIVWDSEGLPVLESSGKTIKANWDDVTAVSFETYFISTVSGSAVGIKHFG